MALFNKKTKKEETVMASAPEDPETPGETKHIGELDKSVAQIPEDKALENQEPDYREIPVCMSQTQINSLVIQNNIMLKELMAIANEE